MNRPALPLRECALVGCLLTSLAFAAPPAEPAAPALPAIAPGAPGTPRAPAEIVKPVTPSKSEIAESAFRKLDVTNKGYVDRQDVRGLDGFSKAFDAADPDRTGRLNSSQFKKAWSIYTGH